MPQHLEYIKYNYINSIYILAKLTFISSESVLIDWLFSTLWVNFPMLFDLGARQFRFYSVGHYGYLCSYNILELCFGMH